MTLVPPAMAVNRIRALALACGFWLSAPALARSDIAELTEQMGIQAHEEAMRDRPSWHEPRKIVMRQGQLSGAEIRALLNVVDPELGY